MVNQLKYKCWELWTGFCRANQTTVVNGQSRDVMLLLKEDAPLLSLFPLKTCQTLRGRQRWDTEISLLLSKMWFDLIKYCWILDMRQIIANEIAKEMLQNLLQSIEAMWRVTDSKLMPVLLNHIDLNMIILYYIDIKFQRVRKYIPFIVTNKMYIKHYIYVKVSQTRVRKNELKEVCEFSEKLIKLKKVKIKLNNRKKLKKIFIYAMP